MQVSWVGHRYIRIRVLMFFLIVLMVYIWYSRDIVSYNNYHQDEGNWIEISKWSFNNFFTEKNFSQDWQQSFMTFGAENPNAAKFIMGYFLYLGGYREFDGMYKYERVQTRQWNIQHDNTPTAAELRYARLPIIIMTALTAGFLFVSISLEEAGISGILGGWVATALFLMHPLTYSLGRRAMLDMPAVFFSFVAIIAIKKAVDSFRSVRNSEGLTFGIVGVIMAGFAVSTKLNAGLICVVIVIIATIIVFTFNNIYTRIFFMSSMIFPVFIFFLLDPQLWPNVNNGIAVMLNFGQSIVGRKDKWQSAAIWTIGDAVDAFYKRVFMRFSALVLTVGGLVALFYRRNNMWPILVWLVVIFTGVLWWTPLNWGRYYLPVVPVVSYVSGYFIAKLRLTTWKEE